MQRASAAGRSRRHSRMDRWAGFSSERTTRKRKETEIADAVEIYRKRKGKGGKKKKKHFPRIIELLFFYSANDSYARQCGMGEPEGNLLHEDQLCPGSGVTDVNIRTFFLSTPIALHRILLLVGTSIRLMYIKSPTYIKSPAFPSFVALYSFLLLQ